MPRKSVLVVEDDPDIVEVLVYNLNQARYEVRAASSGEEALASIRNRPPALVLLDLMLPRMDGLEVCRHLKNDPATSDIPVMMLTAKGEEPDIVVGLELGADDYITKPFSPRVLMARVKAVLRRRAHATPSSEERLQRGRLLIDPGRHEVLVEGRPTNLTPTEFGILHMLARKPGWVFTRGQIVDGVRGENYAVTERAVDVQIVGLRKKLADAAEVIETVRGVGYRYKA
jgi:two-component system phosphate regulon response regulator PhoB